MDIASLDDNQELHSGLLFVGQKLAKRRLAKGLNQTQLADQLHLAVEQLDALESGYLEKLPEPVFIKAMVRRLSNHLKMDADAMVVALKPLSSKTECKERRLLSPRWAVNPSGSWFRTSKEIDWARLFLLGAAALGVLVLIQHPEPSDTTQPIQADQSASLPFTANTNRTSEATIKGKDLDHATFNTVSPPATTFITINSKESSWIALRRKGAIEFEGMLEGQRKIDNPGSVEIYAGRPDLVVVTVANKKPTVLGRIDEIGWVPLTPGR
ncbi:helix-turn-helix domain-containing protein [Synechococcus sp. M16CYN]|uniref:helix-turn-helix domain-containing protein n=1 Tax=Synechococcus sp. M16CYN TaxID=3103139 RepID=UPI003252E1C0